MSDLKLRTRFIGLTLTCLTIAAAGAPAAYADAPTNSNTAHVATPCTPTLDAPTFWKTDPDFPTALNLMVGTGHCFSPGGKVRIHLRFVGTTLNTLTLDVTASPQQKVCWPPKHCSLQGGGDITYSFSAYALDVLGGFVALCNYPGTGLNVRAHDGVSQANAQMEVDKLLYC